jgi:CheY-like chemotaxis protein
MNPKRVLIVDDDADMRLAVRLPLESAGYTVVEAAGVTEGRAVIKQIQPQLIVLDVMMETATAGFQLALDLHSADPKAEFAEFRNIPIIMLTAIHTTTPLRFAPDADYLPVQVFLEKPVDPEKLIALARQLMGGEGGA